MATSKQTRAGEFESTPFFLELFRRCPSSDDREHKWRRAIADSGEGSQPMRFPIYESLFLINVHAQKLVDLLKDVAQKYGVVEEQLVLFMSMIQYVRAGASQEIVSLMNDVELTEEWLFEGLRRKEETELGDSDDTTGE